jgi:integrase
MASITKREGKKGVSYKVTIRVKGYPTQTETFKKLTDAKRWSADTESAISQGKHFKTIEAKKHTLKDLIDRYIKSELPKKPKSEDKQKAQLEWWKEQIGYKTLLDITTPVLVECKERLLEGKTYRGTIRSGATANRYMAALSHVFTKASTEWGWMETNPLSKVSREKETQGRVRYLSDDERTRLLDACKKSRNQQLYLIVMMAISTGARHGEIMGLTWDDVSFDQRRIVLRDTKNGETRAVPLVGEACGLLKEYSKVRRIDTSLVFPREGLKGGESMSIRVAWDNAIANAKIENFRFHDLRHTCASYLAMDKASLAEIAEVLGHKTLAMVKRYAHLSEQHTLTVVERMNEKIFGGQ